MKEKELDFNGHEYVDLGLPSGTLWAKCNVGAEKETDSGLYFTWGETEGFTPEMVEQIDKEHTLISPFDPDFEKKTYKTKWEGEKIHKGDFVFTKYNEQDKKSVLDLEDDAARANMGGNWRMPSLENAKELINPDYVKTEPVANYNDSGVNGYLITSLKNGNQLFLPLTGELFLGCMFTLCFEEVQKPFEINNVGVYLLNQLDVDFSYNIMSIFMSYRPNSGWHRISAGSHHGGAEFRRRKYSVRGVINHD